MTQFKRIVSMFLVVIMVMSLLPLSVIAEDIQSTHTVSFKLTYNGAPKISIQKVTDGELATEPEVSRTGYILEYWYTKTENGNEKFDFSKPVTKDLVLYARWKQDIKYWAPIWNRNLMQGIQDEEDSVTYTVTFDANGSDVENLPAAQTVKAGECAIVPVSPTRNGYMFAGWYIDELGIIAWDDTQPITQSIKLYASWYYAGVDNTGNNIEYKITELNVDRDNSSIDLEITSVEECFVEIIITNEEQSEIVYKNTSNVSGSLWYDIITYNIPTGTLPEYFYIHAILKDGNGNSLSDKYTSVMYTKVFEEFYNKTIEDFEPTRVLNFSNNPTNNFVVTQEDVTILRVDGNYSVTKNDNIITLTGNNFPSIEQGNKYIIYDGKSIIPLQADTVEIFSDKIVITTSNDVLTDYFYHIKIEEEIYASQDANASESVSYTAVPPLINIDPPSIKQEINLGFTVDNEEDAEISVLGSGYIKNTFKLYLSAERLNVIFYMKEEVEINLSLDLKAKAALLSSAPDKKSEIKEEKELSEIELPIAGIVQPILKIYVPLEAKITAAFNIGFGIKAVYGVEYSLENGGRTINDMEKNFDDKSTVEGAFELRAGLKIALGVEALEIIDITLGGEAGLKTEIKVKAESNIGEDVVSKHECALCLEGNLDFYIKGTFDVYVEIEFLGMNIIRGKVIGFELIEVIIPLGKCYFSLINHENSIHGGEPTFGWGDCPNIAWKVTFTTKDSSNTTTSHLVNVYNNRSDNVSFVLSGNSVFSEFMNNGSYIAKSTIDGIEYSETFRVDDATLNVIIKASDGNTPPDPDQPDGEEPIIPNPPTDQTYNLTAYLVYKDETGNAVPLKMAKIWLESENGDLSYSCEVENGYLKILSLSDHTGGGYVYTECDKVKPGIYTLYVDVGDEDQNGFYCNKTIENISVSEDKDLGTIYLDRIAQIYGTLLNQDGTYLTECDIVVRSGEQIVLFMTQPWYAGFGSFSFTLPKGKYDITISKDGYQDYVSEFTVNGTTNLGEIVLKEEIITNGDCGGGVLWEIYGTTLRIYGSGSMTTFTENTSQPWYQYGNTVTRVIVEDGVTGISPLSFALMRSLKEIRFGADVSVIGVYAFTQSTELTTIVFTGNAPSLNRLGIYYDATLFGDMTLTVYYPANNSTWTETVREGYGGNITWVAN